MTGAVTPAHRTEFRRKGYTLVRGVFAPEEVVEWDSESRRLLKLGLGHPDNLRTVIYQAPSTLPILDRLNPVIDISPLFSSLVRDRRILDALREICGEEMLLFKDKLIYKMPGVPGYRMHQDYSLWQTFPRNLVNVLVSIDAADASNGGVEFFPGYQERLLSKSGELRYLNAEEMEQINLESGEVLKTSPGDMVVFDSLVPHRSGVNLSNRLRRQLYLTYSSARNGDLYRAQLEFIESSEREKRKAPHDLFFR